ncbi:Superoxide dismutase [Cu-Zn] 2 [Wickerhamomyces ciferrii]|uniref:Superoxide dismutase [Cu-Zn] 2 n=1 Tax=Wickerhamomyces ciferrii (strain ATCC 14091 / BCRC 22168 / CBS 111 / JCM 3599 / NBRC 0793 / NRRL Y-1031 F-60-10) TaxID=1206466 RepID=K0KU80_WICCF|nr:Superoxide dismutase [Cu-Zn] 2 [Wickerhamomyces ciferrii]CCH45577.1 Superoxide dismutase [Cu-Zn] 2 [Wickerhamomyces ciferrii]
MFTKQLLFTLATSLALVFGQKAKVVDDNPSDVVLRADFPSFYSQNVVGIIQFYSLNGTTKVHVDITGLPKNAGVFSYHIHEFPVGEDGECENSGKHFNPYGASPDCEAQKDDSLCQVGDLSGKHGLINTTCFETYFYDPYISLDPGHPQYIGNKAINIHLENLDKLACGNIRVAKDPEDLVLLDAEKEAEQVRKYEEVTGVKIEDRPTDANKRRRDEQNPNLVEEVVEEVVVVEDDELAKEAEEVDESESSEYDEEKSTSDVDQSESSESDDDEEKSLDELIYEDIEKHRSNYAVANSTFNSTVGGNSSFVNGTGDHETSSENNGNVNVGFEGILGSAFLGFVVSYLF